MRNSGLEPLPAGAQGGGGARGDARRSVGGSSGRGDLCGRQAGVGAAARRRPAVRSLLQSGRAASGGALCQAEGAARAMTRERVWTAALVVIGDEILSGRTQDKNVAQVATWLNEQGIRLAEVRVVPDDSAAIGE